MPPARQEPGHGLDAGILGALEEHGLGGTAASRQGGRTLHGHAYVPGPRGAPAGLRTVHDLSSALCPLTPATQRA
ncbi:MAG: hypothetical protein Kow0054_18350 [Deferrisoma sp.]